MNKLNVPPAPLTRSTDTRSDITALRPHVVRTSPPQHRLLVLISDHLNYSAMTRQIWELANSTDTSVQLLSLCKDVREEPALRRSLATMCALIQEAGVSAETKVEIANNWVDVIKRNHRSGDLIVCFAEQRAGLLQRPLSQVLQSNLNTPVYIISSLDTQNLPQMKWLPQIMAWAGSAGIIIGSFLLQIRITSLAQDWAQTTLMILSVLGEIWLIWVWNSLFS